MRRPTPSPDAQAPTAGVGVASVAIGPGIAETFAAMTASGAGAGDAFHSLATSFGWDAIAPFWKEWVRGGNDALDALRVIREVDYELAAKATNHEGVPGKLIAYALRTAKRDSIDQTGGPGDTQTRVDAFFEVADCCVASDDLLRRLGSRLAAQVTLGGVVGFVAMSDGSAREGLDLLDLLDASRDDELVEMMSFGWSSPCLMNTLADIAARVPGMTKVVNDISDRVGKGVPEGDSECLELRVDEGPAKLWIMANRPHLTPLLTVLFEKEVKVVYAAGRGDRFKPAKPKA